MDANRPGKICMVSLGCPKNLVDSEVMLGILKGSGMEIVKKESEADVIVVNTCAFIGDAKEESIEAILELARFKETGRLKRLIVAGCLSQRYKEELARELPEVDCFIGTGEYSRIAEAVSPDFGERVLAGIPTYIHDYDTPRLLSTPSYFAYVKIAEGCSNHCSYCSIPSIRGEFRSRTVESVVKEAESLASQGVKEINLIAQDTTSFGAERGGEIAPLLRRLSRVRGIEWIRPLYLYPGKITEELISVMKGEEKVLKYIDLPLQHISPRVLKDMNRRYTRGEVESLIERLRNGIDGVILRTSLIVGFPGETDKEFEELLSFVEEIRFDRLGVFMYSREEGTPAFEFRRQVPRKVKAERMNLIMEAQREISLKKNESIIGSTIDVLIEGDAGEEGREIEVGCSLKGRAGTQAPDIDGEVFIASGPARKGEIKKVKVTGALDYDLIGRIE